MADSLPSPSPPDEDGYELWLRYRKLGDRRLVLRYREQVQSIVPLGDSPTLRAATAELARGLSGLLGVEVPVSADRRAPGALLVGSKSADDWRRFEVAADLQAMGAEGFALGTHTEGSTTQRLIAANSGVGVLYGAFHFLRQLQTASDISALSMSSRPLISHRLLNHWDNLDRTVERGYAGFSLWDWQKLPDYVDPRYTDYARACASVGINGSVLTNVNSNALVLTEHWLDRVAALADVFRPYGLRVYLTARFSAPIEVSGLITADPLNPDVRQWWRRRVDEIYRRIPDFGGFLVKANSEGQPGPQNYARSHADGANLLADALADHGGIVMWRAFVYDHEVPEDRAKQAYAEFTPFDGQFRSNVMLQVKNGPIDFQPREPPHPLFGAMPRTPLLLELQLTQEYLGCATHLAYLGTLFKECLDTDTFAAGAGSTVARIIDGRVQGHSLTAVAAVTNIGTDRNWCGHPFAASNWYAYGRLAWDHGLPAAQIAEEWVRMTFSNERRVVRSVVDMMMESREAIVDYMAPLGLHHQMALNHHYGPGPWVDSARRDGTSTYYHRASKSGIGFDRTQTGSNALEQYPRLFAAKYETLERCPEELLLWFHHVPWDHTMRSGLSLWEELCTRYQRGVDKVRGLRATWASLEGKVDRARFQHVGALLRIQEREARWWRDSCTLYFQTFSEKPLPEDYEPAEKSLVEYRSHVDYYVPGIRNPFVPKRPGKP